MKRTLPKILNATNPQKDRNFSEMDAILSASVSRVMAFCPFTNTSHDLSTILFGIK